MASVANPQIYDCIIVGGGPAGLTAGIYLRRYQRTVLVIDAGDARIKSAPRIMNLAGFASGIPGTDLLDRMLQHAKTVGLKIALGSASVQSELDGFLVSTENEQFRSRNVIVAVGAKDIQPDLCDWSSLCANRLIGYCPICDGFEHRNKNLGILIEPTHGLAKTKFVRNISKNLTAFNVSLRPLSDHHQRQLKKMGIRHFAGTLAGLTEHKKKLQVKMVEWNEPVTVDFAYVELGMKVPLHSTALLKDIRIENGRYWVSKHRQTSVPGVYAIGDCANTLAQVSVAMGEAATAATHIHNCLIKSTTEA